jgi:MinD-like ATPase involved in chromosome partitioning or flagellar assembly
MIAPPHGPGALPSAPLLVASGKGGVGTSIVASLLAIAAAERGDRTLLVDATEAAGSLHHLFGVRPRRSLWHLGVGRTTTDDLPIELDDRLSLVAGGMSGDATPPVDDAARRAALARLAPLCAAYETVVIDGGSRLDSISATVDAVDPRLVLVTAADRLSLAANYALIKAIGASRSAVAVTVIANRHGAELAQEACEFLRGACSHFLGRTIDVAEAIPDDPCLQAATGAGMSVRDALDGSPAADAVRTVLSQLIRPRRASRRAAAEPVFVSSPRRWS